MSHIVVALLPMRGESERVPEKNTRMFAGRPLYRHVLRTLCETPEISAIYIDTDSERIAAEAPAMGDQVKIINRPEHLRAGTVSMNDVLLHDVSVIGPGVYLQTHCTNPLLRPETISRAIQMFSESTEHDSLFSVTPRQVRFWTVEGEAINHDPAELLRTQDLAPVYEENSNLYLFDRATLVDTGNRIGKRPLLFPISADEAWDIDEIVDFEVAEFLFRRRSGGEESP